MQAYHPSYSGGQGSTTINSRPATLERLSDQPGQLSETSASKLKGQRGTVLSGGRGRAEEKEKRMGNGKKRKRLGKEGMGREEEKGGRGEEKIT